MTYMHLENISITGGRRSVVVLDIDGCLVDSGTRLPHLLAGDRKAYDELHPTDRTIPAGVEIYKLLLASPGVTCVFITSRQECSRGYTELQLQQALGPYVMTSRLLMRPIGDQSNDVELKPRLLAEAGFKLDEVLLAVEDGDAMVEHWRSLGITCWQTQPGHILHPSKY